VGRDGLLFQASEVFQGDGLAVHHHTQDVDHFAILAQLIMGIHHHILDVFIIHPIGAFVNGLGDFRVIAVGVEGGAIRHHFIHFAVRAFQHTVRDKLVDIGYLAVPQQVKLTGVGHDFIHLADFVGERHLVEDFEIILVSAVGISRDDLSEQIGGLGFDVFREADGVGPQAAIVLPEPLGPLCPEAVIGRGGGEILPISLTQQLIAIKPAGIVIYEVPGVFDGLGFIISQPVQQIV